MVLRCQKFRRFFRMHLRDSYLRYSPFRHAGLSRSELTCNRHRTGFRTFHTEARFLSVPVYIDSSAYYECCPDVSIIGKARLISNGGSASDKCHDHQSPGHRPGITSDEGAIIDLCQYSPAFALWGMLLSSSYSQCSPYQCFYHLKTFRCVRTKVSPLKQKVEACHFRGLEIEYLLDPLITSSPLVIGFHPDILPGFQVWELSPGQHWQACQTPCLNGARQGFRQTIFLWYSTACRPGLISRLELESCYRIFQ